MHGERDSRQLRTRKSEVPPFGKEIQVCHKKQKRRAVEGGSGRIRVGQIATKDEETEGRKEGGGEGRRGEGESGIEKG